MPIVVTELGTEHTVQFVSKDRSVGHFLLRQIPLICMYALLIISSHIYQLQNVNSAVVYGVVLLLCVRAPITDYVQSIPCQGIQIASSGGLLLLPQSINKALFSTVKFIPQDQIEDVFINEAFKGLLVVSYLALVVKDQYELQVLFEVCHVIFITLHHIIV